MSDGSTDVAATVDATPTEDVVAMDTAACSPTTRPYDDLVVDGSGLSAYEGVTVHVLARFDCVSGANRDVTATATVASGRFMVTLSSAFDHDLYGFNLYAYADVDRDGRCGAADAAWSEFVSNTFTSMAPVVVPFDPTGDAGTMAGTCTDFP